MKRNRARQYHRLTTICCVAILIIAGTYAIFRAFAQTPYLSSEPETGMLSTPALKITDTTASGGNAVRFGPGVTAPVIKLMPLGDSITQGYGIAGAYRTALWQKLVQTDKDSIDFVGTQSGGSAILLDGSHEGHSGWCIDGTCRGPNTTLMGGIDAWLAANPPDIILIHAGTNDIGTGSTGAQVAARLDALLARIYAKKPGVYVVVAKIIVMQGRTEAGSSYNVYNAAIPGVVTKYQKQGRHTELVDMSKLLNTSTDYADGWHPNQAGFNKMGAAWYPKVSAIYKTIMAR